MSERLRNTSAGSSLPRTEPQFRGFPELRSNVLYCPKQFFTVVIPHSSVNCIRLVAYMLRKTLGWVDEYGEPLQEQHHFTYREFEGSAGIVHSGLQKAITEALEARFISCRKEARMQTHGVRAQTAVYELCWDEQNYTNDRGEFRGFYLHQAYIDRDGQNRVGRKNIPNIFFDYLVRNENRGVIRVVGTLLWYSIDWGKGGERRQPVRKSLRDLVELTQLDKSSVVRALDEAEEKQYVERLERGVFDRSGKKQNSSTVYGIHWTSQYTYTPDGVPVEFAVVSERSKNATQPIARNAPKTQHRGEGPTLQKCNTTLETEHSNNATRHAPKTQHEKRSKNATTITLKTEILNTPIENSSSNSPALPPVAVVSRGVEDLLSAGFSNRVATSLAERYPEAVIRRQIELLPHRKASRNRLGLLRKAIEENWPAPAGSPEPTEVCSSPGLAFAANFYAGYHGNPEEPVSTPSEGDGVAAGLFLTRLIEGHGDDSSAATLGRQFGMLVFSRHQEKRQHFPALKPAITQFGDEFLTRVRSNFAKERKDREAQARTGHFNAWHAAYRKYLEEAYERNAINRTPLFRELLSEEEVVLKTARTLRVDVDRVTSTAGRLERFERLISISEHPHDVLDFWSWDEKLNPARFSEERI